jgi:hypothetical protein
MSYVTKDEVDKALILWHQAADRASLARIAWRTCLNINIALPSP